MGHGQTISKALAVVLDYDIHKDLAETHFISNTFFIHFSSTNTPKLALLLLFTDEYGLYLEYWPLIIIEPRLAISDNVIF